MNWTLLIVSSSLLLAFLSNIAMAQSQWCAQGQITGTCQQGACSVGSICINSNTCCTIGGVVNGYLAPITSSPIGGCYDRLNPSTGTSDCPSRAYLCQNTIYYQLMTQQCPRTCGRC